MSYRRHALPESEDILLLNDVRHRAQHSIFWRSIKKSGKLIIWKIKGRTIFKLKFVR